MLLAADLDIGTSLLASPGCRSWLPVWVLLSSTITFIRGLFGVSAGAPCAKASREDLFSDSDAMVQDVLEGRSENGKPAAPLMMWQIDVRDVARAHLRAAELPQAKGRYLVSVEMTTTPREVSDLLSARFPEYEFPQLDEGQKFHHNDSSKVRHTMVHCRAACWRSK